MRKAIALGTGSILTFEPHVLPFLAEEEFKLTVLYMYYELTSTPNSSKLARRRGKRERQTIERWRRRVISST